MTRQQIRQAPRPTIYAAAPAPRTIPRQRWLYILLWFIAGPVGIHSFYRRCPLQGMVQMLMVPLLVIWFYSAPAILRGHTTVALDRQFVPYFLPFAVWCLWLLTDLFVSKDGNGIPMD